MKYWFILIIGSSIWADFHVATRYDARWKYQDLGPNCSNQILLARYDQALPLTNGKELYLRLDIPTAFLDCRKQVFIEVDEEGIVFDGILPQIEIHQKEAGLSDIVTKVFLAVPFCTHMHWGIGTELMFPTATAPELGTGKYRARPMIGIEYSYKNFWTALFAKYEFSFAGQAARPSIDIFYLQPILCFNLPQKWILAFAPEIQWNDRTDQWFVPFAALIAKTIGTHFNAAFEYKIGIITDFPVFQQETELILSYLF